MCLPMQETQEAGVWSLGWEDPLEEEMGTHSRILTREIPWTKELGRLQSMGSQRVGHDWEIEHTHLSNQFVYLSIGTFYQIHLNRAEKTYLKYLFLSFIMSLTGLSQALNSQLCFHRVHLHKTRRHLTSEWPDLLPRILFTSPSGNPEGS